MLRYAIGLVALLTIFSSCDSDFRLTGDYEEKALIYGILDTRDNPGIGGDGHFFRIQKAFLGEESAFVMALEPDSSYFKYQDIFVELVEYNGNGVETNRWKLDTVMIANKDTGNPEDGVIDFFGPSQRLYRTEITPGSQVNISASRMYEITLKKRPVGVTTMTIANMDTVTPIADSRIDLVDISTFKFNTPNQNAAVEPPISQNGSSQRMNLVSNSGDYLDYTVKFNAAERGRLYEVWFRFYYREVRSGVETLKSIEWLVKSIVAGSESVLQVPVSSENIFNRIGSEVPVESGVVRKIGRADGANGDPFPNDGKSQDFDIFVRIAGEAMYEYIDINDPSNAGVLQDKPVYTNINNGLGVFSSRSEVGFLNKLYINPQAAVQLVDGEYTSGRGFVVDPN